MLLKCFLITVLLFSIAVVAYSQTSPAANAGHSYKSNFGSKGCTNSSGVTTASALPSKNALPGSASFYRNDAPVISIVPVLKLWLMGAAVPNPFMKEDE